MMNRSESITEINKALNSFHKEVKQPFKDKTTRSTNQNMYHLKMWQKQ